MGNILHESAKKRLEAFYTFLKNRSHSPTTDKAKSARIRLRKRIQPLIEKAFNDAGLDANKERARNQLLIFLIWAVYDRAGPGAPKKWTRKKMSRLLEAVDELRKNPPKMNETECCKLLAAGKAANGRFEGFTYQTLRRVLQNAKRLERQAESLSTAAQSMSSVKQFSTRQKPRRRQDNSDDGW